MECQADGPAWIKSCGLGVLHVPGGIRQFSWQKAVVGPG